MDEAIFFWFNQFNGTYDMFDTVLSLIFLDHFKSLPFMVVIWALWFLPETTEERTDIRERLTAAMLLTLPVILITRALANYTTFSPRPLLSLIHI